MKHEIDPLFKRVTSSAPTRPDSARSSPADSVVASRRKILGSVFALVLGAFAFNPERALAQVPEMTLEEAVKPPELRKTVFEPIDASKLQGSYFDQFFKEIQWKGQMIRYDAKDASVHSHATSERTMSMVNDNVEETAKFSNAEVEVQQVCSGTTTHHGKTYVKPSGDMLRLSIDSFGQSSTAALHFDKVMVSPEDPLTRIIVTPIYECAEGGGNYQLTNILFSRENADGSTTKLATEDILGLPIGHDMGLPVRGKWTKTVETIDADYMVHVVNTDYDRVAIPVHQDTYDRRVFALANEVIVALPAMIGAVSKGKTIHMDVLWTCSNSAIVKSMFAFDKQGKFFQDITERYARAG